MVLNLINQYIWNSYVGVPLSGGYVIYILGGPHNGIIAICRFWDANRPNLMWCKLHAKPATTWIIILQLFINLHTTLNNLFFPQHF